MLLKIKQVNIINIVCFNPLGYNSNSFTAIALVLDNQNFFTPDVNFKINIYFTLNGTVVLT